MEIKEIEGQRIQAGDTILVVASRWWTMEIVANIQKDAKALGVKLLVLPPDAQVYIKGSEEP